MPELLSAYNQFLKIVYVSWFLFGRPLDLEGLEWRRPRDDEEPEQTIDQRTVSATQNSLFSRRKEQPMSRNPPTSRVVLANISRALLVSVSYQILAIRINFCSQTLHIRNNMNIESIESSW